MLFKSHLTVIGIKFEIYRTILTYLNYLKELTDTEKPTDPNHRKALLLKT